MTDRESRGLGKTLLLYGVMAMLAVALLEVGLFILVQLIDRDDFFDHRQTVFERMNEKSFELFLTHVAHPVLGWDYQGPREKIEDNCLGEKISYSYGKNGARLYEGFDPTAVSILVSGDSYTHGDEVQDNENYVAQLASITGLSVANHGVGGFGPTQSFLNLKEKLPLYPDTSVVVLGIMYENLMRMVNSYRPVLYASSSDYTLKPYARGSKIYPLPDPETFSSLEAFKEVANEKFDSDFWAKPELEFPYIVSLSRALSSEYFMLRRVQKNFRDMGSPEYFMTIANEEIREALITVLNAYGRWAVENDVSPVVLFIPRNRLDLETISAFIAENRDQLHPSLIVGDVATMPDVDWEAFNLQAVEDDDVNICHPSQYGYKKIAEYLSTLL